MKRSTRPSARAVAEEAARDEERRRLPPAAPDGAETVAIAARFTLYTMAILLMMLSLPVIERSDQGFLFREGGPVEWTQFALLVAACALCLLGALQRPAFRGCLLALATAAALASVRELDSTLDRAIAWGGWKLPFTLVGVAGVAAVVHHRASLVRGLGWLLREPAFALFWAGFVVAVPFAQLAGHGPFLELVLGDAYDRSQKRLFEELGELIGYVLIFLAAIEVSLAARQRDPSPVSGGRLRPLRQHPPAA